MRLPDVLGVLAALVVGGVLTALLLASAVAAPPTLPTPPPVTVPPLPTLSPAPDRSLLPTREPDQTPRPMVAIGQPAPPLVVTLTDGSLLDTADYAGTPMWINFMATWCPQCVDELPLMQRYQDDYAGAMNIFIVDVGEDPQTVRQFVRGLDVRLPVGVDEDGSVQSAWGAYALPVHVFIDAGGIVREVVYGGAPLDVWDAALAMIVPDFGARLAATGGVTPPNYRAALEAASAHLDRRPLLIISDFDGTLSNIVNDPWGASILPLGRRAVRSLAGVAGVHMVVLSGRTARDVAVRVRVGGVTYVGNHGMERSFVPRGGRPERLVAHADGVDGLAHEAIHAAERLAEEVPRLIGEPWLVVEPKPPTVAFHWRAAPDVDAAAARVVAAVNELDPAGLLEQHRGRRVLELRPPGAVAKGEAFVRLVDEHRPRSVVILGDDVSDALAFEELHRMRSAGVTDGIAVAVQARAELPPRVLASADVVLPSPTDATRFLSAVARHLSAG